MDLNDKEILVYRELLGSSNPNPIDLNDEKNPVHQEPLGFSASKPSKQGMSFPVITEIAALTAKRESRFLAKENLGAKPKPLSETKSAQSPHWMQG